VSPDALAQSPELAALDILRHAADVARVALLAAHPELQEGDFVASLMESRSIPACCADAVLTHLEGLEAALARYRALVAAGGPPTTEVGF
jgi:hypothetical protein